MNSFISNIEGYFNKKKKLLGDIFIVLFLGLLPVIISQLTSEKPTHRYIHIENFRYGKNPSVIQCNRGDILHLTFSSKDTGHSFFIEEFDIDVKLNPSNDKVLIYKASDPTIPPVISDTVVIKAEHPGILKYLVSKSNYRCHVWCGPLHAFEQGKIIIYPNTLYNFGLGVLFGLLIIGIKRIKESAVPPESMSNDNADKSGLDLFKKFPRLKKLFEKNRNQLILILFAAILLYIVILITILGTKVSGRNLGVMLIWIVWLFLVVVIFTPIGGRFWCMICPIPILGEMIQRRGLLEVRRGNTKNYRNRFFGLNLTWPSFLQNGWLRLLFFMITGTLSTTLVAVPRATGIAVILLVVFSTAMAFIWELRSFCRYICPINAFIGTYSKVGELALRHSDATVCSKCKPVFCKLGSNRGWACPYGLNVNEIDGNFDCGLCMECVRSCLYDNVTLRWRKFGSETTVKDKSLAWTIMAMFVLGITYTIVYLGHWPRIRDYINIVDKGNWDLFGIYALILWSTILIIFPAIVYLITKISKWISGFKENTFSLMIETTAALLPLGLFIWIAFAVQMLFVNVSFIGQSLSDPFGWGWNLLGLAGSPWKQFLPRLIPWLQVIFVLIGFSYSFRNLWRIWINKTMDKNIALKGIIPFIIFIFIIAIGLIGFYSN